MKIFENLRFGLLSAMLTVAMGVLTTSCSDSTDSKLLNQVPPTAVMVERINLEAVLASAGIGMDHGHITLPANLPSSLLADMGPHSLELLLSVPTYVKMDEVVVYTTRMYGTVVSFELKDPEAFAKMIEAEQTVAPTKQGDYTVYSSDGPVLVTKGNTGWMAESVDSVVKSVEAAAKKHFGQDIGLYEYLSSTDAALVGAAVSSEFGLPFGADSYAFGCVRLNGPILSGEIGVMDSQGKRVTVDNMLGEISTDFLRYVPQEAVITAAVGNLANKSLIQMLIPRNYAWVSNYVNQIDGTSSFFAAPAGAAQSLADFSYDSWNMQAMIHMPQATVNEAVSQMTQVAQMGGIQPRSEGHGQWSFREEDVEFYYGNIDGYFTIATNREISSKHQNSLNEAFAGKRAAVVVDIPMGSEAMKAWRLPYGLNLRVGLQSDRADFRLRFNGTDKPVLETLIEVVKAMES